MHDMNAANSKLHNELLPTNLLVRHPAVVGRLDHPDPQLNLQPQDPEEKEEQVE